ncbi:MAG: hydrolase, variant 1 family protein [Blastococcus sp.]|nr:hydrolase, variant 1 family protein [Blastococcus sp.]
MTDRRWRRAQRRPPVVLFDWDGTLVDTRSALLAAWHDVTMAMLGRRFPVTADEQRWAFGRRGAETFPELSDDPTVVSALVAGFTPAYQRHAAAVTAFPGVRDLLARLRAAGCLTGVITSKTSDRFTLDAARTALGGGWQVVVCAEDVARGKPDPEPVETALRRLGAQPSAAVLVGDSPADMVAAVAAGTRGIGVAWGFSTPTELLDAGASLIAGSCEQLLAACLGRPG